MYEPHELLQRIDANLIEVLGAFAIDSVFQVWWLVAAAVVAKRDQAYSIPLFCTYYWFAHDFSVVIRYHEWFVVYDHWYMKLFWVVLLIANILEWFYLWQIWRYGRKELYPNASPLAFAGLLAVGLVFSVITHEFFRYGFADPLYQLDPTLTMLVYPAFGAAMLLSRGSNRGQTAGMWWNFTAMTAGFHAIAYIWFGPAFQSLEYVLAAIAATLGGIAMAFAVRSPRWQWDGRDFDGTSIVKNPR